MKKNKMIIKGLIFLIIILYYVAFVKYNYGRISFYNMYIQFMICTSNIIEYSIYEFGQFISIILTEGIVKILVISFVIMLFVEKFELQDVVKTIVNLKVGPDGVTIERKLESLKKTEEEAIENIRKNTEASDKENEIAKSEEKIRIIEMMIDNPYLVEILNKFINKHVGALTIKFSKLTEKHLNMEILKKIFDYKLNPKSVTINSIKEEVFDVVIEVFTELSENGAIYIKRI